MKRFAFAMTLAMLGTCLATGCALAQTSENSASGQRVLRVGTNMIGAPWSFHDAQSNSEKGIAVDIVSEIAKANGYSIEFVPMPTIVELIPALISKKIDLIAANMLVSPERKALIDFSQDLLVAGDGLLVLKSDAGEYRTISDLKGATIGTQTGSPFVALIQKTGLFPDLKTYTSVPEAMQAVSDGKIKGAIVGSLTAGYEQHLGRFADLRIVKTYQPLIAGPDALGVRKSDGKFLKVINASLTKLKADGSMKAIFAKYGIDSAPAP